MSALPYTVRTYHKSCLRQLHSALTEVVYCRIQRDVLQMWVIGLTYRNVPSKWPFPCVIRYMNRWLLCVSANPRFLAHEFQMPMGFFLGHYKLCGFMTIFLNASSITHPFPCLVLHLTPAITNYSRSKSAALSFRPGAASP